MLCFDQSCSSDKLSLELSEDVLCSFKLLLSHFSKLLDLLDDLLDVFHVNCKVSLGASQNGMSVRSSVIADLVIFSTLPVGVQTANPLVNGQVVKCHVRDDLLFDDARVSLVGDAIFSSQSRQFGICGKAVLDCFGERISKLFNEIFEADQVANRTLSCLIEEGSNEYNSAVGTGRIKALDDSFGVG